jgi:RNA polymerase sigma-70 factor (ECF subfamily)
VLRQIPEGQPKHAGRLFTTTHWSVVLALGNADSSRATAALEVLCKTYWYPLYAYLRRRGFRDHDAQDHVQGLFAQLMQRRSLERVTPERGKFRSFLLAALNHFVQDQRDRDQAAKRGGGCEFLELNALLAEGRYQLEPKESETPESLFERAWAVAVLDETMRRLSADSGLSENAPLLEQLLGFLTRDKANRTFAQSAFMPWA